ncbi:MAG: hypothetical protein WKF57_19090 [Nakamurella sp.]
MGTIVRFTDPASEIKDAGDLTAYVLPGMSGDGVRCVEDGIDTPSLLAMSPDEGSIATADLVAGCIQHPDLGRVIAMYAVGFGEDGAATYPAVADCASTALTDETPKAVHAALQSIFAARLDLPAPPTSPDVAADYLMAQTDCLDPVASVPPTPVAPSSPVTTAPEPVKDRIIDWTLLRPGECVVDLPDTNIYKVTVTDCAKPHESEVVGATFAIAGTEETTCDRLFTTFTGKKPADLPDFTVDRLVSTDTFANPKLICFASSYTVHQTTGSLAAP